MTPCGSATCNTTTNTFIGGLTCNGGGSCLPPAGIGCGVYLCKTSGCPGTCGTSLDCINGYYCDATHHCAQQATPGGACSTATSAPADQCSGGLYCTNGFCCGTSSCLTCYTCAGTGTCAPVDIGLPDPTGTCPASCATDNSTLTESFCDGIGGCGSPVTMSCGTTCSVGPPPVCQ
jgi:hypothetical protein